MTNQNNIAQVAVQAELCPNQAVSKAVITMVNALNTTSKRNMQTGNWSTFSTSGGALPVAGKDDTAVYDTDKPEGIGIGHAWRILC